MMGLPGGLKSFKIDLVVLIQYRLWQTPSQPASQVPIAITLNAKASSLKMAICTPKHVGDTYVEELTWRTFGDGTADHLSLSSRWAQAPSSILRNVSWPAQILSVWRHAKSATGYNICLNCTCSTLNQKLYSRKISTKTEHKFLRYPAVEHKQTDRQTKGVIT